MIAVYIIAGIILYISIAVSFHGFFKYIKDEHYSYGRKREWLSKVSITSDPDILSIACGFWFVGVPVILAANIGTIMAFFFIQIMDHDKKDRA